MKKRLFIFFLTIISTVIAYAIPGPLAVNDTEVVSQNSTGNIFDVTSNDVDTNEGILSVMITSAPLHGAASVINGNQVTYTPASYFYGFDSLTYSVCDTIPLCATAKVYITIVGYDYPPVAASDSFTFGDTVITAVLNVLANDTDPEHYSFFVTNVMGADTFLGKLQLDSATGQVIFNRTPLSCGTDSFEYVVCDTLAACDTGSIIITINCPDNVFLPQGISPNGDGKNDKLVFTGLEYFSPASLTVFNRYGNTVYQNDNYLNNWEGTNRDNTGEALPDGTYFYILILANKHKYVNYLVINR